MAVSYKHILWSVNVYYATCFGFQNHVEMSITLNFIMLCIRF